MKILPHTVSTTNDLLTSRAGLLSIAELMQSLELGDCIDKYFPQPGSNRGFKPSVFLESLILMQHEGGTHLDDIRHLRDDDALRQVLGLEQVPQPDSIGDWLRRMGQAPQIREALSRVNQRVLQSTLHQCKGVTLDIDATEIVTHKSGTQWTYKKNRGYMPMVGHIAETGQIVSTDFRPGNASPAKQNLEFIQQCQADLPEGCYLQSVRIDAAGYQSAIIKHCDKQQIKYAIRARMSAYLKGLITSVADEQWQPLLDRKGKPIAEHSTYRCLHFIADYETPFTLVVQRKPLKGQAELDIDSPMVADEICAKGYLYRAIASNQDELSDSEIVHWYNQRGEDSENRIKELKLDFGADTLPCADFDANALYFSICALSFNLFALMRQLLPNGMENHRASTIRWRLYAVAAKVVKTGRQVFIKVQESHQALLDQILTVMKQFDPPPI